MPDESGKRRSRMDEKDEKKEGSDDLAVPAKRRTRTHKNR